MLRARRATDGGRELVEVALPAVITVAKDAAQLRMPSIAGVLAAQMRKWRCAQLPRWAPTRAHGPFRFSDAGGALVVPERTHEATAIEGTVAQQADRLAELIEEVLR